MSVRAGYFPQMRDWITRVVRIRTTHDGAGRARGIVTGMGATPRLALAELRREAEGLAQQAGQEAQAAQAAREAAEKAAEEPAEVARRRAQDLPDGGRRASALRTSGRPEPARPASGQRSVIPVDSGPPEWRFEVVDVRLTPALMEGGGSGWLAYGTLAREGNPPQASTTGAGSGSYGGDRGGRETR